MAFTSTFVPRWHVCSAASRCSTRHGWERPIPVASQRARITMVASASAMEKLDLAAIGQLEGTIELPGSKSLSNRVLLLAALSSGETTVTNLLDSDDVTVMLGALASLGVCVRRDGASVRVVGSGGNFTTRSAEIFLGNAGTAMRPLSAALAFQRGAGTYVLDGTPRMRERPIADLSDALKQLGADVQVSSTGCPPVRITTVQDGIPGGEASVRGSISSQYLSALLMAAPLACGDIIIRVVGTLVSIPYVKMTIGLMSRFGVEVECSDSLDEFTVRAGQTYAAPDEVFVEGDASSASYFLAGAAISGGRVTVSGCGSASVQGDVRFASVLEQMGAKVEWTPTTITVQGGEAPLSGVDVDCVDIPDAAMSLASIALFASGPTAIRNVYNWRVKETERMKAIVTELRKLGATVEEGHDYCVINPPATVKANVEIDTYDDHRMAMAFSLVACGGVPVTIVDPKCTAKTFPTYFEELDRLSQST